MEENFRRAGKRVFLMLGVSETKRDPFRDGDPLDGQGAAVHWAPATRKTNAKHYAAWLRWLDREGLLSQPAAPWERAAPARVDSYARALMKRSAPRTDASALIGLKSVLKLMNPDRDWRWLMDMTNRLDCWAEASRPSRIVGIDASAMFAAVVADLEARAKGSFVMRRDQLLVRDTLIVGLLLANPVRLRNFAMMEIGRHLRKTGRDWRRHFEGDETKTGEAIDLVVPEALAPSLEFFLNRVRPALPGADRGPHVWPGCKGEPLTPETLYDQVKKRSEQVVAVALSPHDFRALAATTLAHASLEDAVHAHPLLGHRRPDTTEAHYTHASRTNAGRFVAAELLRIREA